MVIFTIEYLLRLLTVHAVPQRLIYPKAFLRGEIPPGEPQALVKVGVYVIQPMNIVDLLSILPFYMSFYYDVGESKFTFLRLMRLVVRSTLCGCVSACCERPPIGASIPPVSLLRPFISTHVRSHYP